MSYLRYLCLFTYSDVQHVLCFCFVFLRLVYPMLAVSLGGLLFILFVFVYYTRIVFLFCFSSSCVPYVDSFSGRALIFTVFRLLTDFVCLYNYEFWLSLCKIVRSSVILFLFSYNGVKQILHCVFIFVFSMYFASFSGLSFYWLLPSVFSDV
jgi:hypothetical protein